MNSGRRWGGWLGLLVGLAYLVPYAALQNLPAWYGAFLFWCLFALAVIGSIARMTRGWRD
ncbi:hypothetical protein [Limnochorda pilosa]|uniref:Apolipoprotein N-acyltransferase n=1 Tax=Limnochorda pilosa TaxID=1555112 RepID=A0A0K2SNP5_LIMPI|nr:hypothetical protein [Limnochorda pilosa]BAS28753.1 hypothetical protein LIP_2924 [Limnochorda pilosa]